MVHFRLNIKTGGLYCFNVNIMISIFLNLVYKIMNLIFIQIYEIFFTKFRFRFLIVECYLYFSNEMTYDKKVRLWQFACIILFEIKTFILILV